MVNFVEKQTKKKGLLHMQILNSHKSIQIVKQNFLNGYSDEVKYRYNKLEIWQRLKA